MAFTMFEKNYYININVEFIYNLLYHALFLFRCIVSYYTLDN